MSHDRPAPSGWTRGDAEERRCPTGPVGTPTLHGPITRGGTTAWNVFVFGPAPVFLAVAGYRRHEPIAVPALVVGTVVFGLNLYVSISG